MKSFRYIATLAVAAAGLATQADTIPITYSYTGANFTFGTGPPDLPPMTTSLLVLRWTNLCHRTWHSI